MYAQIIRGFGSVEVFEAAELPLPEPGPGQLRVRQIATSVNPVDCKLRRHGPAIAPPLPAVLGCDVAGHVDALGAGVSTFQLGEPVYGCAGGVRGMAGAYAEAIVTDPALLARAPRTITLREAAALPLAGITAWEGLVDRARLQAGEHLLVIGGSGGVGHLAVQIGKALGARVTATASSPAKAELVRGLGADNVVDLRRTPVAEVVREHSGNQGFAVVFDATGGSDFATAAAAAALNGRIVSIVTNYTADLSAMHLKGLSLHAVFMLIPMLHNIGRAHHRDILEQLAKLVDDGKLRPLIDPVPFNLSEVRSAHECLESGQATGKLVLTIAGDAHTVPALASGRIIGARSMR